MKGSEPPLPMDGFMAGGNDMGALMRSHDWTRTSLGHPDQWPQSLRTSISTCINCSFPILIWWGPDLIKLYNDAYRTILGAKHPSALGRPGREVWPEIWDLIGPMLAGVLERGEATRAEDLHLPLERHGFPEECYFNFSYSPIRDESGAVGGVFCPVVETTERVLAERRTRLLRDIAQQAATLSAPEAFAAAAMACLSEGGLKDFFFGAIYLRKGEEVRLVASAGLAPDNPFVSFAPAAWQLHAEVEADTQRMVAPNQWKHSDSGEESPWQLFPENGLVVPLGGAAGSSHGALVLGLSPHRPRSELCDFAEVLAGQISAGLANANAHEQERRRAAALTELDRAKTVFFSNVSHEFRTPLTLMLGPIEDMLAKPADAVSADDRPLLEVVRRSALRLQKLVDSLLEFSRIEAGRAQALYVPTDLAELTTELVSFFQSALDRAGLLLHVRVHALPAPVHVDRDMWEKIILNLVSNAFKFTLEGEIRVMIQPSADGSAAEVTIADTGIGIPPGELPYLFDRFHRVQTTRGRSLEGTGIGLALARELVQLHGGQLKVESEEGRGSAFTVSVPFGTSHLPPDRLTDGSSPARSSARTETFLAEVTRWLPIEPSAAAAVKDRGEPPPPRPSMVTNAKVLLADDNADMRSYVARLLDAAGFVVETATDGQAALEAARSQPPDLVLADVMMPRLDGIGLLHALRADPRTAALPVILLSARAGEESRVEGLQSGADDYLVKPFSARELIARIEANIRLAALRRTTDRKLLGQKNVLELIATAAPIETVLDAVAEFVEREEPRARCGVLTRSTDKIKFSAVRGPSLPKAFRDFLGSVLIQAPYPTPAAEAVHAEKAVLVPDITSDATYSPNWRQLMLQHDVQAVRVTPIRGSNGQVLGALPVFFSSTGSPSPSDPSLLDVATHLASIAIERQIVDSDLKEREDHLRVIIAEQATTEQQLRELTEDLERRVTAALAERRVLAEIVESTDAIVMVIDLDYRWLAVNRAAADEFERAYGIRPNVGGSMLEALSDKPEHLKEVRAFWDRALAGEEFTQVGEFGEASRTRRHYEVKFNSLRGHNGELMGAYQFVYDVTDRIEGQKQLADAQAQLHEMQKLETLGQLTGGIAHDFNNLLVPIVTGLDILRLRGGLDVRYVQLISNALQSAERARVLVGRLLSFARRQDLQAQVISIPKLVHGMTDLIDRPLGSHIQIEFDLADETPAVMVDPNQLELAILNLCVNARDAMPEGGRLLLSTDVAVVAHKDFRNLSPGRYVRLSVSDTGTGMDPDTLRRAIEPFYTTKGVGKGTGLGLSMVHGLAAQSGGSLVLDSFPGRGTTASIYLPVAENMTEVDMPIEVGTVPAMKPLTILVVDDEDLVRAGISEMLTDMGHRVVQAASGAAALELLQENSRFNLMVTDYMMPSMTGVALVREARMLLPDLPVLLVTGYAKVDVTGGEHLPRIGKPFRQTQLAESILALLGSAAVPG